MAHGPSKKHGLGYVLWPGGPGLVSSLAWPLPWPGLAWPELACSFFPRPEHFWHLPSPVLAWPLLASSGIFEDAGEDAGEGENAGKDAGKDAEKSTGESGRGSIRSPSKNKQQQLSLILKT